METRPTADDERGLFVEFITKLLAEPTAAAIAEVEEFERHLIPIGTGGEAEDNGTGPPKYVELSIEDFITEVQKRLLGKLYDLRDKDMKISMMFMTIMAVIKKLPKE